MCFVGGAEGPDRRHPLSMWVLSGTVSLRLANRNCIGGQVLEGRDECQTSRSIGLGLLSYIHDSSQVLKNRAIRDSICIQQVC